MLSGVRTAQFGRVAGFGPKVLLITARPLSFRADFAPHGRKGKLLPDYERRSEVEPNG
jgi:hypothetical protein